MENSKALIRLPYFGKNGSWSWALITMTILIFQVALMAFHWFILIFVLIGYNGLKYASDFGVSMPVITVQNMPVSVLS